MRSVEVRINFSSAPSGLTLISYFLSFNFSVFSRLNFLCLVSNPRAPLPGIFYPLIAHPHQGDGTPLQYSCLANPMDGGGAWWAAVHGVTKSRTQLSNSLSRFTFMHWRRKWQPTPVFLPGESQGQRSLVGCRLWGCTESDTTEVTQQQQPAIQHSNSVYYYYKQICFN